MSAPVDVLAVTNFVEALRLEIEIADAYAPSYEAVELRIVTMRRDVAAGLLESLEELIKAASPIEQEVPRLTREQHARILSALARVKGGAA